jgi:hypothetical protein
MYELDGRQYLLVTAAPATGFETPQPGVPTGPRGLVAYALPAK